MLRRCTHELSGPNPREVGAVNELMLLNASKDDWLFAVEAFGLAGHRSLALYPSRAW